MKKDSFSMFLYRIQTLEEPNLLWQSFSLFSGCMIRSSLELQKLRILYQYYNQSQKTEKTMQSDKFQHYSGSYEKNKSISSQNSSFKTFPNEISSSQSEMPISINKSMKKLSLNTGSNSSNLSYPVENNLNYSLIPLCCRTYFFDQQRILTAQDKRTEYKSYRFPFSPASIQTFKKTVCAFLNTAGGDIYVGIKETTNRKYRYVLGNYLTQNAKEQVIKTFRKISESIYPNVTENLDIQFVPIRKSPFPEIDLLGQYQTYFYDFTKKSLNLNDCPYLPARYVIRVRVSAGKKDFLYSYAQTEYQLNKNSTSKQFFSFRSQNEVLVKEISQEVLRMYKKRFLYEKQKDNKLHEEPCLKPQIGNPKNQSESEGNSIDTKRIEACLYDDYQMKIVCKKVKTEQNQETNGPRDVQKLNPRGENDLKQSQSLTTQDEIKVIYNYPLAFIAKNISIQKLRRCIDRTPAKDYTKIETEKNAINGQDLYIITVDKYSRMQQFLRVKNTIEQFYSNQHVELVGISKKIEVQNQQNKRVVQSLLSKNPNHKCVVNKRVLEFYSLIVAASYFVYMKDLGFRMEVLLK